MKNKKLFASLMLLSATLMWGLSYSIQAMSADNLGSFTIVFFKGVGGIFLLPLIIIGKKTIDSKAIVGGFLCGLVAFIGCATQQIGLELSTVSKASFITSLYIVMVPILEIFTGKKIKKMLWFSIGLALLGLYFLCFSSTASFSIGDLLLLACSFFFALQIMLIDRYSVQTDVICLSFVSQTTVALLSMVVMLVKEKPEMDVIMSSLASILYLVFISGMIAQTIQVVFQKDVGPSLASLLMSFESVFGAIGGWLIMSQTLSVREIVGCLLVFIAILIAEQ